MTVVGKHLFKTKNLKNHSLNPAAHCYICSPYTEVPPPPYADASDYVYVAAVLGTFVLIHMLNAVNCRGSGLMVSGLDSRLSFPRLSWGHSVVFLGKTLYSHGTSLHPDV